MFGLIRYKSDDFSGNSNGNSEICVVLLSFLIYRSCLDAASCLVLSYVLANTPMESNGQRQTVRDGAHGLV